MFPYPAPVEASMKTFFGSLREKDRRRYAAVEANKLGHGGVAYIARLLDIHPQTIHHGLQELQQLPDLPPERCRKKGAAESGRLTPPRHSGKPSATSSTITRPAAPPAKRWSGRT